MYSVHYNHDGIETKSVNADNWSDALMKAAAISGYSINRTRSYLTGKVKGWDYGTDDERVMPVKRFKNNDGHGVWVKRKN